MVQLVEQQTGPGELLVAIVQCRLIVSVLE